MSRYQKLFRRAAAAAAAASVAIAADTANAQELPAPAPLDLSSPNLMSPLAPVAAAPSPILPVSGFLRGSHGPRTAPACGPCAPGSPFATWPVPPGAVRPGTVPPGTTPPGTVPPGMTPPGMDQPAQPPAAAPEAPNLSGLGAGADVGQTVGLNTPNLFGDLLGGRATQVFTKQTMPGFLNGKTVVVGVSNVTDLGNGQVRGNLSNGSFSIRDATGRNLVPVPSIRVMGMPVSNPLSLSSVGIRGSFTETVPVGTNTVYTPTGANAATANYVLQYLQGTNLPRPAGVGFTIPSIVPVGAGRDFLAQPVEQAITPNARLEQFTLAPVQAEYDGNELRYVSQIASTVSTPTTMLVIPNPGSGGGGGGVVGILKISEDNNPLPRDRVIFNYDYFDNVPFTPAGVPVNRYQFGVEKTFLDGWTSLEVRAPFASTINSDAVIGSSGTNTEFGNLRLAAKVLLLRRQKVNISTGLGVYLPTADDIRIGQTNGRDLIKIENSSVQLAPFAALLWTPNDRLFAQAWISGTFDTGGNQVTVDPMMFGGAANIGNLRGANLLTADLQLGYWVYQADKGLLRGAAPFVELHYNGAVTNGSVLSAGSGFFIGDTTGNFDELNLTTGVATRLGESSSLSVGVAAPLRPSNNRTFDYQIGVRFNWFFGYTAQRQSRATSVSTFGG